MNDNYYWFVIPKMHPGAVGMDATYAIRVYDNDGNVIAKDNLIIVANIDTVRFNGLEVIVPYSVRSGNEPLTITAINKKYLNLRGSYTFEFSKFTESPTFFDDFDMLNTDVWSVDDFSINGKHMQSGYTENSHLVFRAEKEGTMPYGHYTKGVFEQAYGCFSAKIKMPLQGLANCAFWLCSDKGKKYILNEGDPEDSQGEIDILEYFPPWGDDHWSAAIHYCGWTPKWGKSIGSDQVEGKNIKGNWHIWSLVWTREGLYWYFDDKLAYMYRGNGVAKESDPMFMRISCGIRDFDFWNCKFRPEEFPFEMLTDWIKVYGLKE